MATLLSAVTTSSVGTGASHAAGNWTIQVPADSTFDSGTVVEVEMNNTDTSAEYTPTGIVFKEPGFARLALDGAQFLRGRVRNATGGTSVSLKTFTT